MMLISNIGCTIKSWKGTNMRTMLAAFLIFLLAINQVSANSDISNDEFHRACGGPLDLLNPSISQDVTSADLLRLTTEFLARRRVQYPEEWELLLAEKWEKTETDDGKLIIDIDLATSKRYNQVIQVWW